MLLGILSVGNFYRSLSRGRYDREEEEGGRGCSGVIRNVFGVASPTLALSDRVRAQVCSLKCCVFECSTVHRAGRYEHVADQIAWKLTVIFVRGFTTFVKVRFLVVWVGGSCRAA